MGDSLGFHIIFVLFGMTLPILVSYFELMGIRRKDSKLTNLAHTWAKIMAILVITGVISGTIIAFQMTLVWPGILKFGGQVIGLPFMFETYAFLIEAVFLGLYMTTWHNKRITPLVHWSFGLFVILGSTLSAFAITSVNAWMNLPAGFDFVAGKIQNIDVLRAMFSVTSIIEFVHSMPAYYLAACLSIVALISTKLLRTKSSERQSSKHALDRYVINCLMVFAAISFVAVAVTGDLSGKYLAKNEPVKLAAMESLSQTKTHAPLVLGGIADQNGSISGPHITIPNALSILAGNSVDTKVVGLDSVPKSQRPPAVVHPLFDIKLLCIGLLALTLVGYFSIKKLRPSLVTMSPSLWYGAIVGYLGIAVVELGWMITEIGRQPWAVRGYVTTEQAITTSHSVGLLAYFFPLSYVGLFFITIVAIRRILTHAQRPIIKEKL